MTWERDPTVGDIILWAIIICALLLVFVLVVGCTYTTDTHDSSEAAATSCPYYTLIDRDWYSGCYCMDARGINHGYPPGYHYWVYEDYSSPFMDSPYYDNSLPPYVTKRMLKVDYINQSAWVPFSQWPSCRQYGEWA